jgi:hypothetical protein
MTRSIRGVLFILLLTGFATPASAQLVHSISFGGGFFFPRGFDSRVEGDVLVANLTQPVIPGTDPPSTGSLVFEIGDFRSFPLFGEWHVGFGRHLEASAGLSFSNRKVSSVYADLIDSKGTPSEADDTEIEQDLRLKMIPITGVLRFLPFGDARSVQPYAGVGITAVRYRYSEVGDFVDTGDLSIFNERYVATGTAVGPVLLGGVRLPMGGDIYALTIEGRYQFLDGPTNEGFLGERIDLSGGMLNFGFLIRF